MIAAGQGHSPGRAAAVAFGGVFAEALFGAEPAGRYRHVLAAGLVMHRYALVAKAVAASLLEPVAHLLIEGNLVDGTMRLRGRLRGFGELLPGFGSRKTCASQLNRGPFRESAGLARLAQQTVPALLRAG